ncbi:MAG: 3-dehydroquinate dehydratase [Marinilabiliales bacterium]|nr:MAG: 3-dehydroquinate dehydratase [Marinilabiliales bacterium]
MANKIIQIIDGPNLNLTGKRENEIYGNESVNAFLEKIRAQFPHLDIHYTQNNIEGEIINIIQECGKTPEKGIIINPGGYSHTSVAIADAIRAIRNTVIEVHISNVHSREDYRQKMITGSACKGIISGLGLDSYRTALEFFSGELREI